jgi:hypothetical protein
MGSFLFFDKWQLGWGWDAFFFLFSYRGRIFFSFGKGREGLMERRKESRSSVCHMGGGNGAKCKSEMFKLQSNLWGEKVALGSAFFLTGMVSQAYQFFSFSCNKGNQRPGLGLVMKWSANNSFGHILTS